MLFFLMAAAGAARSRKRTGGGDAPGQFDYYLLSMSWAPDFCDSHPQDMNNRECGRGNQVGFIVHGLWPQFENGKWPKECTPARPVSADIVNRMLPLMMDQGLVQHEWKEHGTCSALSTADYFDTVRRAAAAVTIPDEYKTLSRPLTVNPQQVDQNFAQANPAFPAGSVRTACSNGEVTEVHVCFTKDLKAMSCPASERDCPAGETRMLPLR